MIAFDAAHDAVHYPADRRFRIWIRPSLVAAVLILAASAVAAAWIEFGLAGLPAIAAIPQIPLDNFAGPNGFPAWVRYCHFFNFLFVTMLIRSGLSILVDHPRLYFNDNCTPGSEWIRFTPIHVPRDRIWTAKDDARYISPLVATPGYRHTVGIARVWHFITYTALSSPALSLQSCCSRPSNGGGSSRHPGMSSDRHGASGSTMPHCTCLPEPNGFYGYNALQQIGYFSVVFVFGPMAILTGIAMSPAVVNTFPGMRGCSAAGNPPAPFIS